MALTDWTKLFSTPKRTTTPVSPFKPQGPQNILTPKAQARGALLPTTRGGTMPVGSNIGPTINNPFGGQPSGKLPVKQPINQGGNQQQGLNELQRQAQEQNKLYESQQPPTEPPKLTGQDYTDYYEGLAGKDKVDQAQKDLETAKKAEQTAFEKGQSEIKGLIEKSQTMFNDLFNSPEMASAKAQRGQAYTEIQRLDAEETQAIQKVKGDVRAKGVPSWAAAGQMGVISEGYNARKSGYLAEFAIANDAYEQGFKYAQEAYNSSLNSLNAKIGLVQNVIDRAKTLTEDQKDEYKTILDQAKELYKEKKSSQKEASDLYVQLLQKGVSGLKPTMSVAELTQAAGPELVRQAQEERGLKLEEAKANIAQSKAATAKAYAEITGTNPSAKASEALSNVALVNDIIGLNPKSITGVGQNPFNFLGLSNQEAINKFNQLKASLSLENRSKLKGQGAVSDFEGRMLDKASSALGRNLPNDALARELNRIRGVFMNAAGLEAGVKVTSPSGEVKNGNASRAEIDKLIAEGNDVDYN